MYDDILDYKKELNDCYDNIITGKKLLELADEKIMLSKKIYSCIENYYNLISKTTVSPIKRRKYEYEKAINLEKLNATSKVINHRNIIIKNEVNNDSNRRDELENLIRKEEGKDE